MKKGKGKLRSIHISPADNGWQVESHHEPDGDEGNSPMGMGSKKMVFPHHAAAAKHVKSLMADHSGMSDDDGDEMSAAAAPLSRLKMKRPGY